MKKGIIFWILFSVAGVCNAHTAGHFYEKYGFTILVDIKEDMTDTYLDVDRLLKKTQWKHVDRETSLDKIIFIIGISEEKCDVFIRGAGYEELHLTAEEIVERINTVLYKHLQNSGHAI